MDEAIGDLVLGPFREIVSQGNISIENARDAGNDQMLKAAQALVKEGERALKKIEPLCRKNFDEFGANFINALKDNEEISQFSEELGGLLYDFEDYVEADAFEAEKFAELQALSRKAAPRIVHVVTRMKLEPPPRPDFDIMLHSRPGSVAQGSVASDTIEIRARELFHGDGQELERSISQSKPARIAEEPAKLDSDIHVLDGATTQPNEVIMSFKSGPEAGLNDSPLPRKRSPSAIPPPLSLRPPIPLPPLPPPPSQPPPDPWDRTVSPATDTTEPDLVNTKKKRRDSMPMPESPIDPTSPFSLVQTPSTPHRYERHNRAAAAVELGQSKSNVEVDSNPYFSKAVANGASNFSYPTRDASLGQLQRRSPPLPTNITHHGSGAGPGSNSISDQAHSGGSAASPSQNQRDSHASSNASVQSSVFDSTRIDSYYEMASPVSTAFRTSTVSGGVNSPKVNASTSFAPNNGVNPNHGSPIAEDAKHISREAFREESGLQVLHPANDIPDGLIPVAEETSQSEAEPEIPIRKPDVRLTETSSFYQLKGLCEGAKEVMRGGLGIKRIKKQGLSTGAVEIAKCKFCPYELDFKQLERDINKEDSGNYRSSGIAFRLRFLQKSHLPAKHIEDQLYACLFCIQLGETLDESDATVFFSQKQLFAHLARHPRPLPEVPGLTVIEGKEIPPQFRNDYDLCLENPPHKSQMGALARELSLLPTATAIETYRSTPSKSIRRPPDGMKVLQFAAGAKIVGVEFPAKYGGQWCVGWADHDWAAFPAEVVRLDPPQAKDIRKLGTSNMKAVARWKWSVKNKDRGDWLKLDKGDVITNINWAYSGHWCWSGTNSKGKWGIFPQSHIEPNSLMEAHMSDGASIASSERKRSLRMPPLRHRSTGGSTDTATPRAVIS